MNNQTKLLNAISPPKTVISPENIMQSSFMPNVFNSFANYNGNSSFIPYTSYATKSPEFLFSGSILQQSLSDNQLRNPKPTTFADYENQLNNTTWNTIGSINANPPTRDPESYESNNIPIEEEDNLSTTGMFPMEQAQMGTEVMEEGEAAEGMLEGIDDPIGAIVSGIGNTVSAVTEAKDQATGQSNYTDAISHGVGVGYQNVAQNNLIASNQGVFTHQAFTSAMGLLGPVGALIAASVPASVFNGSSQSSFMENTTGGSQVDAQSQQVINST